MASADTIRYTSILTNEKKTTFVTKWGVFITVVMMFGLKTTLATFQRIITEIFGEYIMAFMQVLFEDFVVYGARAEHLQHF